MGVKPGLTLREEHRIRVFEKMIPRRIFVQVSTRDEVTGGWRKMHSEELHNSYCSPYIVRITQGE
jgi:hypothetical protein